MKIKQTCRWVLIGTRAVCDQAHDRGALRPVVVGLEVPGEFQNGLRIKRHGAWMETPTFALKNSAGHVRVVKIVLNWHLSIELSSRDLVNATPIYRLREALMNQISTSSSGYSARPGIVTF